MHRVVNPPLEPDHPPRYEPVTSGRHRLTKFLRGVGAAAPDPRG